MNLKLKIIWIFLGILAIGSLNSVEAQTAPDTLRTMKYTSRTPGAAVIWQEQVREKLFSLLNLDSLISNKGAIPLNPAVISTYDKGGYLLKEVEINSTTGRRIRAFVTFPADSGAPWPAVLCIHGHGGQSLSVYEKDSPYKGFAHELASNQYVTITCMVSQHEIYEEGMLLMGERLWDLIRCTDYLESLKDVDNKRIGCAGLSLGGEMAMWLGGMDTRIKATVSAGFLTQMDHMEQNHCMCWKFPGLRTLVDFADIYSLTAPRPLMCQNGLKEPPSQFYVPLAREALKEIQPIYRDLGKPDNVELLVHDEGHVVDIPGLMGFFEKNLKPTTSK